MYFGIEISDRLSAILMAMRPIYRGLRKNKFLLPLSNTGSHFHSHSDSFAYKRARKEEDRVRKLGDVYSKVASRYDRVNDFITGGLQKSWKDRLVSKLYPFPGMKHLDVAGGEGNIAFRIADSIYKPVHRALRDRSYDSLTNETQIFVCDINPNMLAAGKKRAQDKGRVGYRGIVWEQGNAEALKFMDDSMDGYTIAFGIRDVNHIERALAEAYRVLKRGGRFLCLELSHVELPIFKELYDYYSFSVIPEFGKTVARDRKYYEYLVERVRHFPSQEKFASMIAEAGFQKVEYENLLGGVAAIHSGLKL